MLSPYQSSNLTSLVNWDSVLLERKYRALPNLELWESLIGMCLPNCYDEMVRDLGGISYEDRLTTNDSSPSSLASEELTTATIQIHRDQTLRRSKILRRSAIPDHSRSDSEISDSGSLLARMRRHVTFTPDTVFENRRTSKRIQDFYQAAAMTVEKISSSTDDMHSRSSSF